jgi:biopolymer transport protein ExbD
MKNTGFLLRFIDIGLIVLFAFVWVSDITTFSRIDMTGGDKAQNTDPNEDIILLKVDVNRGGEFTVTNQESNAVRCGSVDRDALESCLDRANQELTKMGRRPVVLISPSEKSAVQHTVDVLDVCQRLGIPKNINKKPLQL